MALPPYPIRYHTLQPAAQGETRATLALPYDPAIARDRGRSWPADPLRVVWL